MDDIRRQDLRLFAKELAAPSRLLVVGLIAVFLWFIPFDRDLLRTSILYIFLLAIHAGLAHAASMQKRWLAKRYESLWSGCLDRHSRFKEVLKRMRRDQIADLIEMPRTIEKVSGALYLALRRADIISHEVHSSEKDLMSAPPVWAAGANDAQSSELYRLADKNIAEYRQQYAGVMAGVQRTEAQSAVFMTTLDTLRMKMLGYRLVGRSPELSSQDFLEALAEARMQLQSIDHALEELDLGHYPKTISVVPPPMPREVVDDIESRLNQGQ